jgi:hypothetical protein
MPVDTEIAASTYTPIRAPRGTALSCRGWQQEAAMRMLMNNLDEEVAERPQDLVVYGGTGRAARSWEAYRAIVATLKTLADDETLLVQSGKPVGVLKTHEYAPRVLIANSNLVGHWKRSLPRANSILAAISPASWSCQVAWAAWAERNRWRRPWRARRFLESMLTRSGSRSG